MKYNDDEMVELIAGGELTHGQIAERLGVCRETVWRIVHGKTRPELQGRLNDAVSGYASEVRRLIVRRLKAIMARHIKVALEGEGETARICREFLIDLCLETIAPRQEGQRAGFVSASVFNSLTYLPTRLRSRAVEELSGPRDNADRKE